MNMIKYSHYILMGFAQCCNMFPAMSSMYQFGYKSIINEENLYKSVGFRENGSSIDLQNLRNDWNHVGYYITSAMKIVHEEIESEKAKS